MKESVRLSSIVINLMIVLLVAGKSEGDPRSQIVKLVCDQKQANDQTIAIPNFLQTMTNIVTQLRSSRSGTAVTGTGPDAMYGLGECYGDLSTDDCILCYAEAHTVLPTCFPAFGRVHLDGCFMRMNNYSFFEEYLGVEDTTYCGDTMLTGGVFQDSVRRAVSNAVMDAPKNSDFFARELSSSAYVLADCWNTLNETSCSDCLQRASESILKCLSSSEGRALYTGCFMRYSNTNFLNQESTPVSNGDGSAKSQLIQLICKNQQENNRTKFIPNFLKSMEDINTKMQTSHTGTVVTGTGPESTYVLAQCYGDISTSDCLLCCAEARTSLPSCLPNIGGRVYLEGCFMRFENYSFFGELKGKEDRVVCDNITRKDDDFQQAASKAVQLAMETAPKKWNLYAGTQNESAYAAADCWSSLSVESCAECLQKAGNSMLGCLPGSMGYSLYTGCFLRYSDTNFLVFTNPDRKRRSKGMFL
ncbi:putative cysteine-rich receptor-like protein kinase 23 [Bidens hawaiensis]|uniref:putative cysteine-rich receptor-like protein kinase 23 n=1 Tax=Bidens hawaiensis TaxID=980011 RepID=UPI004049C1F8